MASTAQQGQGSMSAERFRAQFLKTELCSFHAKKRCLKGDSCPYAHGKEELHKAPDLTKTSLCRHWLKRCCTFSRRECPFAHGTCDLRRTVAYIEQAAADGKVDKVTQPAAKSRGAANPADRMAAPPEQAADLAGDSPDGSRPLGNAGAKVPGSADVCFASAVGQRSPDASDARLVPTSAASPAPAAAPTPAPACIVIATAARMWPVVAVQPYPLGAAVRAPTPMSAAGGAWQEQTSQAACMELVKQVAQREAVSSETELEALLLRAMPECYED